VAKRRRSGGDAGERGEPSASAQLDSAIGRNPSKKTAVSVDKGCSAGGRMV